MPRCSRPYSADQKPDGLSEFDGSVVRRFSLHDASIITGRLISSTVKLSSRWGENLGAPKGNHSANVNFAPDLSRARGAWLSTDDAHESGPHFVVSGARPHHTPNGSNPARY